MLWSAYTMLLLADADCLFSYLTCHQEREWQ